MRPFKPAPKDASANRVRERYLQRLGLHRGAGGGGAPLMPPHHPSNDQVVVISGLPSLPEDRATTLTDEGGQQGHVLESHDFSIASRHSQPQPTASAHSPPGGEGDAAGLDPLLVASAPQVVSDAPSQCSRSTLSTSPRDSAFPAGEHLRAMALAYPTALRKVAAGGGGAGPAPPGPAAGAAPPPGSASLPFSLWVPGTLSKPASVLLDSAAHRGGTGNHVANDGDSVSSAGTSTTAESSLTAAAAAGMVSRDWGAIVPAPGGPASGGPGGCGGGFGVGLGESPSSAPGVYFQRGGHHPPPSASSLARALHRFNIESDGEASSVASGSVVDDVSASAATMDWDDDDAASRASAATGGSRSSSCGGGGVPKSIRAAGPAPPPGGAHAHAGGRKKKIGKNQRLMDRAAAHERILQIRSDRSRNMRASLVHAQRRGGGGPTAPPLSSSPMSAASLPLLHVRHDAPPPPGGRSPDRGSGAGDLGRTPTASNCKEDLRRLRTTMGAGGGDRPPHPLLPRGIHVLPRDGPPTPPGAPAPLGLVLPSPPGTTAAAAPLRFHPRLASRVPTPPPGLAAGMLPGVLKAGSVSVSTRPTTAVPPPPGPAGGGTAPDAARDESRETDESSRLHHADHQATINDVLEVAVTLSQLGGRA